MDTHILSRLFFLTCTFLISLATPGSAQDCGDDCQCILDLARQSAKAETPDFQKALRLYNAAKICFPDSIEMIDGDIVEMFITINQLKIQADSASQQARIAAQEAIIARDSASSATDRALRESQRATMALIQEKQALDSLVEVKNAFEEEYKKATANENNVLITTALDNKEQFKAWKLGQEKRQLIGDSLGISKDSLVNLLKENDRILVKTKEIDRRTFECLFMGPEGRCVGLQFSDQGYLLSLYDFTNNQQNILFPIVSDRHFWKRIPQGPWNLNAPKVSFSRDGSRIAVFYPYHARIFQVHQDSASDLTTELIHEFTTSDIQQSPPNNLSLLDNIVGVTFTQHNEPFIYSAVELIPAERPEASLVFSGQLLVDVEVQQTQDSGSINTYHITAEYLDYYQMDFQLQLDSTALIDRYELERAFNREPRGTDLIYLNYRYLVENRYNPLYLEKDIKTTFLKFTYPILRNNQPIEWQFGKKYNTQILADQLMHHYSKQFLISKEGPFVSYQNEAGQVLASFTSLGKKIKVRAAPLDTHFHPEMPEILSYDSLNVWGWTQKGAFAFRITEKAPILGVSFLDGSHFSPDEEGKLPIFRSYFLTYTSRYLKVWDDTGRLISAAETRWPIEGVVVDSKKKEVYVIHENAVTSVWRILHPDKSADIQLLDTDPVAASQ